MVLLSPKWRRPYRIIYVIIVILELRDNRHLVSANIGAGIGKFLDKRSLVLALGLVVIASIRIAATYRVFSFTIDEPGQLACGLEYLSKHVYRYLTEQPPLARAAIAMGPYLAGVRPLGGPEFNLEGRNVILQSLRPNHTLALRDLWRRSR